jgi:hypothetical protein
MLQFHLENIIVNVQLDSAAKIVQPLCPARLTLVKTAGLASLSSIFRTCHLRTCALVPQAILECIVTTIKMNVTQILAKTTGCAWNRERIPLYCLVNIIANVLTDGKAQIAKT